MGEKLLGNLLFGEVVLATGKFHLGLLCPPCSPWSRKQRLQMGKSEQHGDHQMV